MGYVAPRTDEPGDQSPGRRCVGDVGRKVRAVRPDRLRATLCHARKRLADRLRRCRAAVPARLFVVGVRARRVRRPRHAAPPAVDRPRPARRRRHHLELRTLVVAYQLRPALSRAAAALAATAVGDAPDVHRGRVPPGRDRGRPSRGTRAGRAAYSRARATLRPGLRWPRDHAPVARVDGPRRRRDRQSQ